MSKIEQYSVVSIKALIDSLIDRDGWKLNKCAPSIGDVGTVTDILQAKGLPDRYVVESSDAQTGITIWISEFVFEELEPV